MPYEIRDNCVYKVGDTKPLQCYDNKEDALAYLQALEANVSDAKKIPIKAVGATIKAIEGNRVGGYLVRFTSKDDPDLHGEYFDESTNFWLKEHPIKGKPILIDHAFDEKFKSIPVGILDFVKQDEIGIWVEGKLKERQDYEDMLRGWKENKFITDDELPDNSLPVLASNIEKAVKSFFGTGKAQWSSGALPQSVEVDETTRHIKSWAIIEGTAVYTPAEPNGTEISLKSLLSSIQTDTPTAHKEGLSLKDANGSTDNEERGGGSRKATNEDLMTDNKESNMDAMEILKQVMAMLQEYLGGMESPLEEGEAERMTGEIEEEMKQELPQEEEAAKMDEEELTKRLASKALAKVDAHLAKRKKVSSTAKSIFDRAKETQLPSPEKYLGGASGGQSRIESMKDLRYAHLSASDMALGILLAGAPAKSVGMKPRMTDMVSESYIKHFAHKAVKQAESEPYGRNAKSAKALEMGMRANAAIKAAVPFKANELDASDIAGQGQEWVAEFWSTDLWERERFERHYDALVTKGMMVETIGQGFDTAYFPLEGSDPVAYTAPEANSIDASGRPESTININPFGTGRVSVTPKEIKIATAHTVILEEDSIINVVQAVNRQLNEAAMETRDKILVNGDTTTGTTNVNYDGTTVPTGLQTPYYIASTGIRYLGITNNSLDASNTLTLEQYRLTLAALDPELRQYYERMMFFIDPTTEIASLALPEIATDDVRRTNATVTSGRLLNVYGIDVRSNGFIPQTDTDGKVTASGNVANRGTIALVYAPYLGFAYKRQISLETARDIYSGSSVYVMSMRLGMVARGTNAVALSYNVATSAS